MAGKEFEETVKNLLRMKPKPHKEKGEGADREGERDKPARPGEQSSEED